MVRLPQNIIASMAIRSPGMHSATKKELTNALIEGGYGPVKAAKWIDTFIGTGAIYIVGTDAIYGRELYRAKWWNSTTLLTRVKSPRIRAAPLTEQEKAILEKVTP